MDKVYLRRLDRDGLLRCLAARNEPPYRADQLYDWLWRHLELNPDHYLNLPRSLREWIKENHLIERSQLLRYLRSQDGTIKALIRLSDGREIECVLIPAPPRYTVCVSTQVGCSLDCAFCATGRMKRERNLFAFEIIDQVAIMNRIALELYRHEVTNVVFMGMGEPLLNYREVVSAIRHLTDPREHFRFSLRRITVSTSGISKMIYRLIEDGIKVKLAFSLHAPTDRKREQIMSISKTNSLSMVFKALESYYWFSHLPITIEYIMLAGFNDSREDAERLKRWLQRFPCKVNLIPYNPVPGLPFRPSSEERILHFQKWVQESGIPVTIRKSRGRDIFGACGQLARLSYSESDEKSAP